jgi:hypothetical protein
LLPRFKDAFDAFMVKIICLLHLLKKKKSKLPPFPQILSQRAVKAWIIANCVFLITYVFEWVIIHHIEWFKRKLI